MRCRKLATVVDIDLNNGATTVYHLGDTRLYRLRNGIVTQITTDQVDRNGDPNEDFGLSEIHPRRALMCRLVIDC